MEAARPPGRRPHRGTVDSPVNRRLVRVAFVLVAPALAAVLLSVSTFGALPPPTLAPVFDSTAATALARELSAEYPSRVPGTSEATAATNWYLQTISAFGFTSEDSVWREDVPDLGSVELRNVVTVIPGKSAASIVLVAHRDNAGASEPLGDNASGTAALIELARTYAPAAARPVPRPQHTIVLVSTDGGAYGGVGAARFAAGSPYVQNAVAVIVLDGLTGPGRPRIALAGDEPRSPAPALVGTASARVREQVGVGPVLAGVATQLVDLGIPFAGDEQGPFLARGIAAITLTTGGARSPDVMAGDVEARSSERRLGQLGRATDALVGSIDSSIGAAFRTPDTVFVLGRVASGWTVRLTLILMLVPFSLGALDLLVRARRRHLPLAPAVRALRTRVLFWLYAGVLLWLGALTGIFPTGASRPLPPYASSVVAPSLPGLALLGVLFALGWLVSRRRLAPNETATVEERLAGYATGLPWLGIVALAVAISNPYSLLFVLPSLYAWLWLPLSGRTWARVAVYLVGLAGPIAGMLVLGHDLGLGPFHVSLYLAGLATDGYVSARGVALALAWAAAATQLGALAFGRYAPYAGGAEPPPRGIGRTVLATLAGRTRMRRYARTM
jgi:hypothetical protein